MTTLAHHVIPASVTANEGPSETAVLYSGHATTYPYPGIPAHWNDEAQRRAQETLTRCEMLFGEVFTEHIAIVDRDADIEDFWENAARAAAAMRAAFLNEDEIEVFDTQRWSEDQQRRRLGAVSTDEEDSHGVDPLLMHPVLANHGGRWMMMGAIPEEPLDERADNVLTALAKRFTDHGVKEAVIKLAARKSGLVRIDLAADPHQILTNIMKADEMLGWTIIRIQDRADQVLVQDYLPMSYEYRLFIVDDKVISGAGQIEEHTPFDRDFSGPGRQERFDTKMRRIRPNGIMRGERRSPIKRRRELRKRYVEFGAQVAAEYKGTVTIDVALDEATDTVIVVELNTLPNSGLFASDVDAVYQALNDATDRGYGTYNYALSITDFAGMPKPKSDQELFSLKSNPLK